MRVNAKLVAKHFRYCDSGNLIWLKPMGKKVKPGEIVGYIDVQGYIQTSLNKKKMKVHRLVWMLNYGDIPKGMEIDHINRIKSDNRIENLRLCDKTQNAINKKTRGSKTQYRGVVKNKYGRFDVYIRAYKYGLNMGTYKNEVEAAIAYDFAALFLHQEFANTNFKADI